MRQREETIHSDIKVEQATDDNFTLKLNSTFHA